MAWSSACRWGGRRGVRSLRGRRRRRRIGPDRSGRRRRAGRRLAGVTAESMQLRSFPRRLSQPAVQAEQSERGVKGVYLRRSSPSSVTEFAGAHNDLRHSDPRPARAISTLTSREEQSKAACTCDCATPSRTLIPARGTRERPGPREAARKRRDRALTSRRHRYTAAHSYAPEAPLCSRRAGDRPRSVRRDGEDVKTRGERRRRRRAAPRQARPQGQEARCALPCGIKFTARSSWIAASTSTPSTRHLLDGVAMPGSSPLDGAARPRRRREMT